MLETTCGTKTAICGPIIMAPDRYDSDMFDKTPGFGLFYAAVLIQEGELKERH
jgi:hypothetical protein